MMAQIRSQILDSLKFEIANELGIQFNPGYNGELLSRDAGRIGGGITRQLVLMAEQGLADGGQIQQSSFRKK